MDKHTKIRIESWCKKFCQITNNTEWKKNRNLHTICLLDMILNERYEEPYNKFAPEGPLPQLPKHLVKSRLTKKFWNYSQNIINNQKNDLENYIFNDNNTNNDNNNINREYTSEPSSYRFKNGKKKNHFIEMINKCNNPDLLKKIIEKLESKINDADEIIIQQNEERNQLLEKIEHLEKLMKPFLKKG